MFQEMLFLAEHGVPWDLSKTWSRARRMAGCVAISERKGAVFSWETMSYTQKAGE